MNGDDAIRVVPVRHVGRWIGSAVALMFVVMLVHTLLSKVPTGQTQCRSINGQRVCHALIDWRFGWHVVKQYFWSSEILHGLEVTVILSLMAMAMGILVGILVAIMRLSSNRLLSSTAWLYTWFFRGTPVFVQVLFWYNVALLYPQIRVGVPFSSWDFLHLNANTIFSAFVAAFVALSLNEGAYMAEIVRSGLISVDEGQGEAAASLGMTRRQTLRLVILPQAMRVIIPPTGNELNSMFKTSSLVSAAGVIELTGAAQNIYAGNYEIMQLLVTACLWYLVITTVVSIGQYYFERHFAQGALRTPPPTPIQRLRRDLRGIRSKMKTHHVVAGTVR